MAYVRRISALSNTDLSVAGGKGASLGEMTKAGIPVPGGFVVLTDAFERFMKAANLHAEVDAILSTVDHRAIHTVENASEKIESLIAAADIPDDIAEVILSEYAKMKATYVAVRSSATAEDSAEAAWAGQLETHLNTTEKDVLTNVKKCWASLFSPRAIFYRFEKNMEKTKVSVAVVVQEMVESEVSGIAFSVHPVTQDRNQIIIEAGFGLGEAIVSGSITPDSFVIRKDTDTIIDTQINCQTKGLFRKKGGGSEWRDLQKTDGEKPALSEKEVCELATLVTKIEKHYGFPVDIEWARAKGRWFILQSRPITTLTAVGLPTEETLMRSLDIFLTRDAPLIAIEHWWDKGCRIAFREFFGFPYPAIISLKRHGVFTAFKDNASGDAYVRTFDEWFRSNEQRINEIYLCLSDGLKVFRRTKKATGNASLHDLASMLATTSDHFAKGLPAVDAVHMLPIVHEQMNAGSPMQKKHLKQLIAWREKEGNHFFHEGVEAHYAILEAIAKKKSWPAGLLKFITTTELARAMKTGTLPRKELQRRNDEEFALINGKIIHKSDIGKILLRSGMQLHEETISSVQEVRGNGVYNGKIQGKARIIFERNQLSRVSTGDILIAPMTSPWYLPGMRKAVAFVTDEGGITCHAAILAREMEKPCVIGTREATKVLRDGDTVEVDADKGIVKVLSSTSSEIEWVHYITRPFTLLGASFWREWYAGEHMMNALGVTNTEAYFLEVYPNVVRYYREKRQMESLQRAARDIVVNDQKKLQAIFDRANVLNAAAEKILKKGWKAVPDFETAVNTVIEMAIHATVVPFLTLAYFDELKVRDKQLRETAEHLRAQSLYPRFFAEIVTQHAEHLVKKLGMRPEDASLLTVNELRRNDVTQLQDRLQARKKGKRFTYTYVDGVESVEWTDDIESMVFSLENITEKHTEVLQGKTAYAGKVTGRARLVLTDNPKGITFNAGDILVSINSTPALMPLIMKCAAMVTDEGGISCHAAIVSRELKKPCVMSTKLATSVIKDGDLIEVDADKGIVKVLKRA